MDRVLHSHVPVRTPLLTVCCLWALGTAIPSLAQTTPAAGTLTVDTLSIGGVASTTLGEQFINAKQCADPDATIEVTVRGLTSANKSTLAVWVGNNCNQDRTTGGSSTSDCQYVSATDLPRMQNQLTFEVPIAALGECMGTATMQVWFMAMDTPESTTEPVTTYGMDRYTVDTDPPAAPRGVSGGRGESQIKVEWSASSGDILRYYVYWDSAIGGGDFDAGSGECSSANLYAGADIDPDDLPSGVRKKSASSTATSTTLDGANIDGDMAGVAVQAVDLAGNVSALSDTTCVDVVTTAGFWELYRADGGDVEEGCACSAPGGGRHGRLPWLGALGLLAVCALRLRRRA